MADHHRSKSFAAGVMLLLGAIVLLVSMFVGWYQVSFDGSATILGTGFSVTSAINFYPGSNAQATLGCSGSSLCPPVTSETRSYADSGFNNTGHLYEAIQGLILGGFLLGLIGGILAFVVGAGRTNLYTIALFLALVALVLAVAGPAMIAIAGPGAIKSDAPSFYSNNSSGPWNSFWGSCTGSSCGLFGVGGIPGGSGVSFTENWGPSAGWYLALIGFVLMLIGFVVLLVARKAVRETAAAPPPSWTPPPAAASTAPPPAVPPAPPSS